MKSSSKVSIRLLDEHRQKVIENLDDFGCRNLSEFVRQSVEEKLERYEIGRIIESSLKKQIELNIIFAKVVKNMEARDINNQESIKIITSNLEKMAETISKIYEINER